MAVGQTRHFSEFYVSLDTCTKITRKNRKKYDNLSERRNIEALAARRHCQSNLQKYFLCTPLNFLLTRTSRTQVQLFFLLAQVQFSFSRPISPLTQVQFSFSRPIFLLSRSPTPLASPIFLLFHFDELNSFRARVFQNLVSPRVHILFRASLGVPDFLPLRIFQFSSRSRFLHARTHSLFPHATQIFLHARFSPIFSSLALSARKSKFVQFALILHHHTPPLIPSAQVQFFFSPISLSSNLFLFRGFLN